jgi:hypothetical protein
VSPFLVPAWSGLVGQWKSEEEEGEEEEEKLQS